MWKKVLLLGLLAFLLVACLGKFKKAGPLALDKSTYAPGEAITVTFNAPGTYQDNAWIGIIPSDVAHGDEAVNDQHDIAYQYLKGQTSGTFTFTAPDTPGAYDMRMHDTDNNGKEVASVSFTVQ
jgi:hypothetical protein